jgi:DNA adenine methylase
MSIYYSPLRYPGGKNCIFPFVSKLFYDNQMIGHHYAEPYAGGSGLALRLLFEGYVEKIYINDLDRSIFAFWRSIIDRTEEFCEWIDSVDVTIENWNKYRDIQDNSNDSDDFELAKSTFFLNRTNVSGIIKGGVIGGQAQKGKYKIDVRFNKKDLVARIHKIAGIKDRITVSNLDGLAFISKLNRKRDNIFIYLDPPYYHKGADLYMNFYSKKDHMNLAKNVHKISKRWMVSYDHQDFILGLYEKYKIVSYSLSQSASNRVGEEVLIFPESVEFYGSIGKLSNPLVLQGQLPLLPPLYS